MGYERAWERLLEYLDELGSAREVSAGIEVIFAQSPGRTRTVEVVMSPRDWDEYISIMYGDGDPAGTMIRQKLLAVPDGVPYLVYDHTYDWTPSETRELPADDFDPASQGVWVVNDDAGDVVDRSSYRAPNGSTM